MQAGHADSIALRNIWRSRSAAPHNALVGVLLLALGFALTQAHLDGLSYSPPGGIRPRAVRAAPTVPSSALSSAISAAVGADLPAYRAEQVAEGVKVRSVAQGFGARFDSSGTTVSAGVTRFKLSIRGFGYGSRLEPISAIAPTAVANRVIYTHNGVDESFSNGPAGLEQTLVIERPPPGGRSAPLTVSLSLAGRAVGVSRGGQTIVFRHRDGPAVFYGDLVVVDAAGHKLRSWMSAERRRVLLQMDTRGARYPLRIDPLLQERAKLVPSDPSGFAGFGYSVALSADGRTALVAGPSDGINYGAAWVFARQGGLWSQQGPKLTPATEVATRASFGRAVALSGDGNTALIGALNDDAGKGAAWVFVREGSTWREAEKLAPPEATSRSTFGSSVALSRDGTTALIGAPQNQGIEGAAWVFKRSAETWEQQAVLAPEEHTEARFGDAVALSADGATALVGGWGVAEEAGRAWAFIREGSQWSQQGSPLAPDDASPGAHFGWSVALSDDGDTALIDGINDAALRGSAWIFRRAAGIWTQQGPKLQATEPRQYEGFQVALAGDASSALLGGLENDRLAAAWSFIPSGSEWVEEERLRPMDETGKGEFGIGVALSGTGQTALIGGPSDNNEGAAWLFERPHGIVPAIVKISPKKGAPTGGTSVTITGKNLVETTAVLFGNTYAPTITPVSSTSVIATSPLGSAGPIDVRVLTAGGISPLTTNDLFTYQRPTITGVAPSSGTQGGGTEVTITGNGFALSTATTFKFGTNLGTTIACESTTTCRVRTPALNRHQTVDVLVIVGKAKSTKNPPSDQYTYN